MTRIKAAVRGPRGQVSGELAIYPLWEAVGTRIARSVWRDVVKVVGGGWLLAWIMVAWGVPMCMMLD